ncbi:MAG: septum formation initiator family protein [Bacteroidetes bacterium]|nr:septum formation initiator family protein [Bacteroidota bacterium]
MNQFLSTIPPWIRNKYFIAAAIFIVIVLFLDKNDLFTQLGRKKELRKLETTKKYYTDQIELERKELESLKKNPATIEKYAREKYLMKKDNEDLFLISEKPASPKK